MMKRILMMGRRTLLVGTLRKTQTMMMKRRLQITWTKQPLLLLRRRTKILRKAQSRILFLHQTSFGVYVLSAEGLGIKELLPPYLDPQLKAQDLLTGVCFASAGSGLDNLTNQIFNVIRFGKEIEYFKEYRKRIAGLVGEEEATTIISKAIFFIAIGSNDLGASYFLLPTRRVQFTVPEYTDFLLNSYTNYIKELYNLDATRFALINVPPLGCLPIERTLGSLLNGGACDEEINQAADGYNSGLDSMIDGLKSSFPMLQIVSLDYNKLISEFIANPSKYGFELIARGC